MGTKIIIVPSQASHAGFFLDAAMTVKRRVESYKRAIILKTVVAFDSSECTVGLAKPDGSKFAWETLSHVTRVVTISHGGMDGHILISAQAAFDLTNTVEKISQCMQPWGVINQWGPLSAEGKSFWRMVGTKMPPGGKILMLGCNMGNVETTYAKNIAKETGQRVIASVKALCISSAEKVVEEINLIEGHHLKHGMKVFR